MQNYTLEEDLSAPFLGTSKLGLPALLMGIAESHRRRSGSAVFLRGMGSGGVREGREGRVSWRNYSNTTTPF